MIDDLSSYELSHLLPFSHEVYLRLFETLNESVWPAHFALLLLAVAATQRLWIGKARSALLLLAPTWFLVAWLFFLERYANLLWAAPYMAAGFVAQGVLLLIWSGRNRVEIDRAWPLRKLTGFAIFGFAVVGLPLVGLATGQPWNGLQLFGLAPDPTMLATLGLITAARRTPWALLVIPAMWGIIGGATALTVDHQPGLITPILTLLVVSTVLGRWVLSLVRRPPHSGVQG